MTCRERSMQLKEKIARQKEELARKDPKQLTYKEKTILWGMPKSRIVNGKQENYFPQEQEENTSGGNSG